MRNLFLACRIVENRFELLSFVLGDRQSEQRERHFVEVSFCAFPSLSSALELHIHRARGNYVNLPTVYTCFFLFAVRCDAKPELIFRQSGFVSEDFRFPQSGPKQDHVCSCTALLPCYCYCQRVRQETKRQPTEAGPS